MVTHPKNSTLRRFLPPAPPATNDAIALAQDDLEDFIARTNAIEYLNRKRQEYLDEALRCEKMAQYIQEALTLWVERAYHVDIEHERWHLDLNARKLVRMQVEEP